jgi:hypothetical protein
MRRPRPQLACRHDCSEPRASGFDETIIFNISFFAPPIKQKQKQNGDLI